MFYFHAISKSFENGYNLLILSAEKAKDREVLRSGTELTRLK